MQIATRQGDRPGIEHRLQVGMGDVGQKLCKAVGGHAQVVMVLQTENDSVFPRNVGRLAQAGHDALPVRGQPILGGHVAAEDPNDLRPQPAGKLREMTYVGQLDFLLRNLGRLTAGREVGVSGDRRDLDACQLRGVADRSDRLWCPVVEHRQMRSLASQLNRRIAERPRFTQKFFDRQPVLSPIAGVTHGEDARASSGVRVPIKHGLPGFRAAATRMFTPFLFDSTMSGRPSPLTSAT